MKFLLDANLSPALVNPRRQAAGHRAVHVVDLGLHSATDTLILRRAADDRYTVITADSDFPMMLALHGAATPSVVHLRHINELSWQAQAALLIANLPTVLDDMENDPDGRPPTADRVSRPQQAIEITSYIPTRDRMFGADHHGGRRFPGTESTTELPDGRLVAVTGSRHATVQVWDLTTGAALGEPLTGLNVLGQKAELLLLGVADAGEGARRCRRTVVPRTRRRLGQRPGRPRWTPATRAGTGARSPRTRSTSTTTP